MVLVRGVAAHLSTSVLDVYEAAGGAGWRLESCGDALFCQGIIVVILGVMAAISCDGTSRDVI
jgi:hypothetical protein